MSCITFYSMIPSCNLMVFNSGDWHISILAVSLICSLGSPLLHSSPVAVFLNSGHLCIWIFNSTVPVDVVRKSYVNCLFDSGILLQ